MKEWSVTIDALATGDQIFLLRKGGIREANRHFELAKRRFLLYPTHFHEAEMMLKPQFRHVAEAPRSGDQGSVQIKAWAEVVDVIRIDQVDHLNALTDCHVWTDEFVAKRIAWKPLHAASLIMLKTHTLAEPVRIPIEPHHKGCKSWVDIEPAVGIGNSSPALSISEWEERTRVIRLLLSETPTTLAVTT